MVKNQGRLCFLEGSGKEYYQADLPGYSAGQAPRNNCRVNPSPRYPWSVVLNLEQIQNIYVKQIKLLEGERR